MLSLEQTIAFFQGIVLLYGYANSLIKCVSIQPNFDGPIGFLNTLKGLIIPILDKKRMIIVPKTHKFPLLVIIYYWHNYLYLMGKRNTMKVLELYENGVIEFLHNKGLLSASTLSYIRYYMKYLDYRGAGKGYRQSVRLLSNEFQVSETTIKKAIKIMNS